MTIAHNRPMVHLGGFTTEKLLSRLSIGASPGGSNLPNGASFPNATPGSADSPQRRTHVGNTAYSGAGRKVHQLRLRADIKPL
eukprot:1947177-Pyramimonas_sp.AAC.1